MSKTSIPPNLMLKRLTSLITWQVTLDLTFTVEKDGKLSMYTKLHVYDKRDDFNFHIVNFRFLSSDIPSGPSYGVYISQLIRYAR